MACGQAHDVLPEAGSMALLNVIIDETGVTIFAVKTLAQVFEEHIEKHRAKTKTHDCQTSRRRRARGRGRRIVSGRIVIRHGKDYFRFFQGPSLELEKMNHFNESSAARISSFVGR